METLKTLGLVKDLRCSGAVLSVDSFDDYWELSEFLLRVIDSGGIEDHVGQKFRRLVVYSEFPNGMKGLFRFYVEEGSKRSNTGFFRKMVEHSTVVNFCDCLVHGYSHICQYLKSKGTIQDHFSIFISFSGDVRYRLFQNDRVCESFR